MTPHQRAYSAAMLLVLAEAGLIALWWFFVA